MRPIAELRAATREEIESCGEESSTLAEEVASLTAAADAEEEGVEGVLTMDDDSGCDGDGVTGGGGDEVR